MVVELEKRPHPSAVGTYRHGTICQNKYCNCKKKIL